MRLNSVSAWEFSLTGHDVNCRSKCNANFSLQICHMQMIRSETRKAHRTSRVMKNDPLDEISIKRLCELGELCERSNKESQA